MINQPENDRYLTLPEAIKVLQSRNIKITKSKMRHYATQRKLPFFRFGKSLYISEAELLNVFKSLQEQAMRPRIEIGRKNF